MNSNGLLGKHWFQVTMHFLLDVFLFCASCYLSAKIAINYEDFHADIVVEKYWPSFFLAALVFSSSIYIAGLYSSQSLNKSASRRFFLLGGCILFSALMLICVAYIFTAHPLGRTFMAINTGALLVLAFAHHAYLLHTLKTARERVAYIVTSSFDEGETHIFSDIGLKHLDFVGVVAGLGYQPTARHPMLGKVDDLADIIRDHRIDRVLVTGKSLNNASLSRQFCKLRYSGVTVMPLIILCEEIDQHVPLELISSEWLLNASGEPQLLYIRKVKRLFDIVTSSLGLVLSLPVLLLAMLLVKLTSKGPVLFYQNRSGRFGKPFSMIKLRTMCMDAEKAGAQWAQGGATGSRDPRVTRIGGILRRYRIDEIPQLWNVLKGEMSFVGPRPERPEMITEIAKQVPYYEERMMVQPGITGWAQVNYPYGASILDSRRKLEYDLYYLKHMSFFLDTFILLDTVRTVLFGGAKSRDRRMQAITMEKIEALRDSEAKPSELELGTA
jgi:exopolysaccharide biosynthesis polyprenyl glycosylphosphotransferase